MLREELDRIDSVPMLPALVRQVLLMTDDPKVSAYHLAEVVSKDLSLVASILRIINSSYYGLQWRISSVSQAVALLGFRTIRNLVLAATVMKTFGNGSPRGAFDRTGHWRHSIACGAAAGLFGKKWKGADSEEAFLAGLVHDVGRVIMDQCFPDEFAEAVALVRRENVCLGAAELEVFSLTHAEVGRHIAQKWMFPESLVEAIGGHHGPGEGGHWTVAAAQVHVADAVVRRLGFAIDDWQGEFDEEALTLLGCSEEEVMALSEEILAAYECANVFEGLLA